MAYSLIASPSEAKSPGGSADVRVQDDDNNDPRDPEDPDDAPETPLDEPKPVPVEDPPSEPTQVPYVVRGIQGLRGGRTP
jgi:hypothetical protein